MTQGLVPVDCNIIVVGLVDVVIGSIREIGRFDGDYRIVHKLFAKDPPAFVTRLINI